VRSLFERVSRMATIPWVAPVLAAILVVGVLAPVRSSALRFDDSRVITENDGLRKAAGVSFAREVRLNVESMVEGQGRPQPLGVVQGTVLSSAVTDRATYKVVLIALTAACLVALLALLRMLGLPRSALPIAAIAVALCLQYRAYHDPVLGYYGTTQVSFLVLIAALIAYLRFLRGGATRWYVATLALTAILLGLYEVNYPLVAAFLCLHLGRDPQRVRSMRWSLPMLGMAGFMFVLAAYTHSNATVVATGYETSLDLIAAVQAALRQLFAPLPSIYFISGGGGLLDSPTKPEIAATAWRAMLAGGLLLVLLLGIRRQVTRSDAAAEPDEPAVQVGAMVALGGVLIVGSVLLLSLAAKYQTDIQLGNGYLPSLLQVMGVAAIACAAWTRIAPRIARSVVLAAVLVLSVTGLTLATQYTNVRVIAADFPGVEQRELLQGALEHGIADGLSTDRTLYYSQRDLNWPRGNLVFYPGTIDYFVLLHGGERADVRSYPASEPECKDTGAFPRLDCAPTAPNTSWLFVRGHRFGGSVMRVDAAPSTEGQEPRALARRIVVLATGTSARGPLPSLAGYTRTGAIWTPSGSEHWTRAPIGDDWVRFVATSLGSRAPIASSIVDPKAVIDFGEPEDAGAAVRLFGTKRLLP